MRTLSKEFKSPSHRKKCFLPVFLLSVYFPLFGLREDKFHSFVSQTCPYMLFCVRDNTETWDDIHWGGSNLVLLSHEAPLTCPSELGCFPFLSKAAILLAHLFMSSLIHYCDFFWIPDSLRTGIMTLSPGIPSTWQSLAYSKWSIKIY